MPRTQGSLRAYVIQRLLLTGPMILIILTLVFYFLRAAPGDPVGAILGERSGPFADTIRRQLGLYDPLYVQYFDYLRRIVTGDMGTSIITQRPVAQDIAQRLPATIELAVSSMIVAVVVGILGAIIGSWLFGVLGISIGAGLVGDILVAIVGAVVLLFVLRSLRRL